jgi:hypothetical protein
MEAEERKKMAEQIERSANTINEAAKLACLEFNQVAGQLKTCDVRVSVIGKRFYKDSSGLKWCLTYTDSFGPWLVSLQSWRSIISHSMAIELAPKEVQVYAAGAIGDFVRLVHKKAAAMALKLSKETERRLAKVKP